MKSGAAGLGVQTMGLVLVGFDPADSLQIGLPEMGIDLKENV